MKRKYLFSLLGACLLAACADIARQPVGYMAVIDVAAAMDNLSPLQLSELGSTVRYVPLETTDSCLIGNNPTLTMAKDYILVQSGNDCFAFDKKTGRFMAQIGHFGEDPQAYSNAFPYYNAQNGQVYFVRYPDKLQRYDLAGHYIGQATVPTPPAIPSSFAFADSAVVGYYTNLAQQSSNGRSLLLFDGQGTTLDTVPCLLPPLPPMDTKDIAALNITELGLAAMVYTRFHDGTASGNIINCTALWPCGGKIHFKEQFIDTVYAVEAGRLSPVLAFHTGKWSLGAEARQEASGTADKLLPVVVLETLEKVFFQCAKGLYENRAEMLNGIYDKTAGTTHMAPDDNGLTDDLNHFLPFTPKACSLQGEYIGLLPAEDVEEWMAGHSEAKNNAALAPLAGVKAEDNPVVVIVTNGQ